MAFEVEVKYRVTDHLAVHGRLIELGAVAEPEIKQADAYLAHPSRDFAQSGEAFRIRREGEINRLTYKGPKHSGPTKTREEIEIAFESGPEAFTQMEHLCQALGFRPVAVVRKTRTPFHLTFQGRPVEITLDNAVGLGTFVEVEAIAADADCIAQAQTVVIGLAARLGLTELEPRSYLRMLLSL